MVKYNFKQFYYFNINVYLLDLKFWSQKAWKEVLRHPAISCLSYHALPGAEMTSPKKMLSKKCPSSKWLFLRGVTLKWLFLFIYTKKKKKKNKPRTWKGSFLKMQKKS